MPLTIGVWLSVPTRVSGTAHGTDGPAPLGCTVAATVARRSMLMVCMMPVPGGKTRNPCTAPVAHFMKR